MIDDGTNKLVSERAAADKVNGLDFDCNTHYELERSVKYDAVGNTWIEFIPEVRTQSSSNRAESYHLINYKLGSGRKHQLRQASAFALSAPIVADFKYGFDTQLMARDLLRRSFKYTKQ